MRNIRTTGSTLMKLESYCQIKTTEAGEEDTLHYLLTENSEPIFDLGNDEYLIPVIACEGLKKTLPPEKLHLEDLKYHCITFEFNDSM